MIRTSILCILLLVIVISVVPLLADNEEDKMLDEVAELFWSSYLADWERRAFQAYIEEKPEVALWALENLEDIVLKQREVVKDKQTLRLLNVDLVLTYGRIAFTYKKMGKSLLFEEYLSRSLEIAKRIYGENGEVMSREKLTDFIKRIDSNAKNHE